MKRRNKPHRLIRMAWHLLFVMVAITLTMNVITLVCVGCQQPERADKIFIRTDEIIYEDITEENDTSRDEGTLPKEVSLHEVKYGSLDDCYTYEGYFLITAESAQLDWKNSHDWFYDGEGFAKFQDRYIIACSELFGNVGDCADFYLENGEVLYCIIGDIKGSDKTSEYGHILNDQALNVVEFCVSEDWYESNHCNVGTQDFHEEWASKVRFVVSYELEEV